MDDQAKIFEQFVKAAKNILITSHISPDPDAVSSVLLLGTAILENFKDKEIMMTMEEKPPLDLSFLTGYKDIRFQPLLTTLSAFKPELFIIVDAMNFERLSRENWQGIHDKVKNFGSKLIIIDHHTEAGLESNDLYINHQLIATAQEIYDLLFKKLDLKKPAGYAEITLLGIVSDSDRFKYDNPQHHQTFEVVSELLSAGASIEKLDNRLHRYTRHGMVALSDLAKNLTNSGQGYSYTWIDDDIANEFEDSDDFKQACEIFTSQFIRNYENNSWGFLVYPERVAGRRTYSVSFRSVTSGTDVSAIAAKLGGGGHKQAAGAKKIQAQNVQAAVQKVIKTISES